MSIEECKRIQHYTDGRKLYLVQQGLFYHAFNEAAEYMSPITGYRIRERYTVDGVKYKLLGFPVNTLGHVINICKEADDEVRFICEKNLVKITFNKPL